MFDTEVFLYYDKAGEGIKDRKDEKNHMERRQKKIAVINDFSGFGRCSLMVSVPIISAMKVQCCALPTAILSNHTGYDAFFFDDYTDKMRPYYEKWQQLALHFDGIYTGFLFVHSA